MSSRPNKALSAHLSLLGAAAFWGLMSPLGKDAMLNGIDGIDMVSFRVAGGALFFWITSIFTPHEHISRQHIALLCLAAVFGLVGNQCCFTIGLSLTSPINAGIATTGMPIFALLLSTFILRELCARQVAWRLAASVRYFWYGQACTSGKLCRVWETSAGISSVWPRNYPIRSISHCLDGWLNAILSSQSISGCFLLPHA